MIKDSFIVPTYALQIPNSNETLEFCKPSEVEEMIRIKEEDSKELLNMIKTLKEIIERERKEHSNSLDEVKEVYSRLTDKQTEAYNNKLEEFKRAIDENKEYKAKYGTLISPILIVKELWNNGTIGELDILIPPSRWKVGNRLNGENGSKAKRYWLSQLEEWGLIKTWGKGKYMANVGMYEALELLNQMMKKKQIKIKGKL